MINLWWWGKMIDYAGLQNEILTYCSYHSLVYPVRLKVIDDQQKKKSGFRPVVDETVTVNVLTLIRLF